MSNNPDGCAVRIAVRERPLREGLADKKAQESVISYHSSNPNILIVDERPFAFDMVLNPSVAQKQVFDILIKPLVGKVLQGFNCTALAYGQTGTGKSYSMGLNGLDTNNCEGENVGIIPRCLKELFENAGDIKENSLLASERPEIYASFIEIYNEKVYDLLAENSTEPIVARGYRYTGGVRKEVSSVQDCHNILMLGNKNRHVRPTKMNSLSSRSHAVFSIHLRHVHDDKTVVACLNLVDLAGSEGVRRTGHQGVAMSEGVHINQGLLTIGKVLHAMTMGYRAIPYRDSVLSSVLQDSLSPNSYLTLLACISPHKEDLSETLSTLRFAQNAKQLKYSPQINLVLSEMKKNKITPRRSKIVNGHFITKTPNKRASSIVALTHKSVAENAPLHRRTFVTPSKIRKLDVNKFNKTEVGMTPKAKQKATATVRYNPALTDTVRKQQRAMEFNRDSLLERPNDTIDSHPSLFSFNVSASTSLEMPSVKPTNSSYSPVVRKCMNEFEKIIDNKMEKMMENLINVHSVRSSCSVPAHPEGHSTPQISAEVLPNAIRQEIKTIMQELYGEKRVIVEKDNSVAATVTEELSPSRKASSFMENPKDELFVTSSPVLKAGPNISTATRTNTISLEQNYTCKETDFEAFDFHTESSNQTVRTTAVRRSQRLSLRKLNESIPHINLTTIPSSSVRRSKRLSSIKEVNDHKRRSVWLAAQPAHTAQTSRKAKVMSGKKSNAVPAELENSLIASYFESSKSFSVQPKRNKTHKINEHKKAVLEMMNSGSMKALQLLPQVGPKTAYQIITHRTLNGKFKSLAQVESLPVWRGKAWERFSAANMLT